MLLQSIIGIALLFLIIAFSIQIYILKKQSNAILTGLLSVVAIVYGTYLWISNGVIIEYGTEAEINSSSAVWLFTIGILNLITGLSFVFTSIFRFLYWYISKWSLDKKLTVILLMLFFIQ
jgi:hypothetical protein